MTTRLCIVLSLLMICLCTKKKSDVSLSANQPTFERSKIDKRLLESPDLSADSIIGKELYIVTKPTELFEVPNQLVIIQKNYYTQHHPIGPGAVIWKADLPVPGDPDLMPAYYHSGSKTITLYWIKRSCAAPITDTTSVVNVCTNAEAARQLLFGAVISRDTGLAAWALRHGALPYTEYVTGDNCFALAGRSGSKEICTIIRGCADSTNGFSPDRFYLDFITGDKADFMKQIQMNIEHRTAGKTKANVMSDIFTTLLKYSLNAQKPKLMLRGFTTAFRMAPREALDTLKARTVWECIHAAVCLNDTASISFLLPYCAPWGIEFLYPLALEPVRTNRVAISYLLDLAEKQQLSSFRSTCNWLLGEAVAIGDTSLCRLLLAKSAAVNDSTVSRNDLLVRAFTGVNKPVPSRYTITEPEICAVVRMLVEHGAKVDGIHPRDTSKNASAPLFLASENGLSNVAAYLISKGANVNVSARVDSSTIEPFATTVKSPLYFAIERNDTALVNMLVKAGASFSLSGCDLFRAACIANNPALCEMVIAQKAVVDSTHLSIAAYYGSDSIVRYLLEKHAPLFPLRNDSIAYTSHDCAPLTAALLGSRYGDYAGFWRDNGRYVRTISALLDAGFRYDGRILYKNDLVAPVDLAAEMGRFDIVNFFSVKGAPVTARIVRNALNCADTGLMFTFIHRFENGCTGKFPFDYLYQIQRVAEEHSSERPSIRLVADTLQQLYLRHNGAIMPQFRAEAETWNAQAAKKDAIPDTSFGNYIVSQLERLKEEEVGFLGTNLIRYYAFNGDNSMPATVFNGEHVVTNTQQFSQMDGMPDTWFHHYNARLIDACTRALDLPFVTETLRTFAGSSSFSNYISDRTEFREIIRDLLAGYDEVMADSAKARSLYESYFKNPFTGRPSYELFNQYGSQKVACFWTRRLIDGSASSLHALCVKLGALFPVEPNEEDESGEAGEGESTESGESEDGGDTVNQE